MMHNVLGNLRKLASYGTEHTPLIRGVSVLGDRFRESGRNTPIRDRFGRFSSLDRIAASTGRMTSPSNRDSNTIKRWRHV